MNKDIKYNIEFKAMLAAIVKAESLGMVFPLKNRELQFSIILNELHVVANRYVLISWARPKESKNNCGHSICSTFTKTAANIIRGYIDAHTSDMNPNRWTAIEVRTESVSLTELKRFISLHTKKKS